MPTPVPSAKPASGEFRELFDHYTKAKSVHERATQNISYEDFERKMKRQKELHREKYQAKDVEYRVVVKDDKVSLVAKPKR